MPIRREVIRHYRSEAWLWASSKVRDRAGGLCERCGVRNHAIGFRDYSDGGRFHEVDTIGAAEGATFDGRRLIKIVLTMAHLDHNGHLGRHDPERMQHLCQRCHLTLDAQEHAERARETRARKRREADAAAGQERLL